MHRISAVICMSGSEEYVDLQKAALVSYQLAHGCSAHWLCAVRQKNTLRRIEASFS